MTRSGLTDAAYDATKERCNRLFKLWTNRLGLGWWRVDVLYDTDRATFDQGSEYGVGTEARMHVVADWRYAIATVTVNMHAASEMDDETLESCIVHELCHVLVCEMRVPDWANAPNEVLQGLREHEERVVTGLTKAFGWTFLAGQGGLSGEGDDEGNDDAEEAQTGSDASLS